eukprot:2234519-Alexandrium_andersonii.AAC.1
MADDGHGVAHDPGASARAVRVPKKLRSEARRRLGSKERRARLETAQQVRHRRRNAVLAREPGDRRSSRGQVVAAWSGAVKNDLQG